MNNFSDFVKNNSFNDKEDEKKENTQKLEDMISNYQQLSQNDLMKNFLKLTIEKKKKGELKKEELEAVKNTLSPMLNDEQRGMLNELLLMVENV